MIVATDDERIRDAVQAFGGEAVMTRSDHRSGTERVAEVAVARGDAEIIVNVQGDEPLIEPASIEAAVAAIQDDPEVTVATLAVPITKPADIMDPNIVKTVLDFDGNALYFSRAPIPWVRDRGGPSTRSISSIWDFTCFAAPPCWNFPTFPQGDLERIEQLEQFRWLENGYRIRVAETEHDSVSVDMPEDVTRVEQLLAAR